MQIWVVQIRYPVQCASPQTSPGWMKRRIDEQDRLGQYQLSNEHTVSQPALSVRESVCESVCQTDHAKPNFGETYRSGRQTVQNSVGHCILLLYIPVLYSGLLYTLHVSYDCRILSSSIGLREKRSTVYSPNANQYTANVWPMRVCEMQRVHSKNLKVVIDFGLI